MNTVRRRGATALTAAIALAIGGIPAAFTTTSILAMGEGTTTLDAGAVPPPDVHAVVCACIGALASTLKPEYADAIRAVDLDDQPVKTFGVKATVVASADLDADTAYALVKTVFDNLDRFRGMHPAFGAG